MREASGAAGVALLACHVLLWAAALLIMALQRWGGRPGCIVGALAVLSGGLAWFPGLGGGFRQGAVYAHIAAGTVALLLLARVGSRVRSGAAPRPARLLAAAGLGLVCLLVAAYTSAEVRHRSWSPPAYDPEACYRFLTATTAEQAGNPHFPSALQTSGKQENNCTSGGCHAGTRKAWQAHAHAAAAGTPAYRRTFADFVRRKGATAGNWCQGCHAPGALALDEGTGVGCGDCHSAAHTGALIGSGALQRGVNPDSGAAARWEPFLRPTAHARRYLQPTFHRSAEFCSGCHRKNYNLPQNQYQWMPGPDPFRDWVGSPYSGAVLVTGERTPAPQTCTGCHNPHGSSTLPAKPAVKLDLFFRDEKGVLPQETVPSLAAGRRVLLDVVLHNSGIGHSFPTGMPDLQESWLEITVRDRTGRMTAQSGADTQFYRLVARDRNGRVLVHGNLDEMASVQEWRRILPGEADLARYRLTIPAGGLGSVRARLIRRRRPEFSRWAREPVQTEPEVVAESTAPPAPQSWGELPLADRRHPSESSFSPQDWGAGGALSQSSRHPVTGSPGHPLNTQSASRWRRYGMALTAVRSYPEALQALKQAEGLAPTDAETHLSLGRMFWEEGDLLAAREQFQQARAGGGDTAAAWEARVIRKMGQPEQSLALLKPLAEKYPRDPGLRFELGRTQMDLLANEAAAREFRAMLGIDPLNVAGHYNLMLCLQRMNQLSEAGREETLYRLLSGGDAAPGESSRGTEGDRPLRIYPLEGR